MAVKLVIFFVSVSNKIINKKTRLIFTYSASDRMYWDGWRDKAMFFRPDGIFTRGNVYINPGDEICIVVLLGPIPAKSITTTSNAKASDHLGPQDSIVMFAVGNYTKKSIQLEQHHNQPNVYFASVSFLFPDNYYLNVSSEYRSYFWEIPILHQYRPFHYRSSNYLVVQQQQQQQQQQRQLLSNCSNYHKSSSSSDNRLSGTWVNPTAMMQLLNHEYYKDLYQRFHAAYESTIVNDFKEADKVFIPDDPCQLQFKSLGYTISQCLNQKVLHAWGDIQLKRNLKAVAFSGHRQCNVDPKKTKEIDDGEHIIEPECVCNNIDEEEEEKSLYPWIQNSSIPYILDNAWRVNTSIYYNALSDYNIVEHSETILEHMTKSQETAATADVIVLGIGNNEIKHLKISPKEFMVAFERFLKEVRRNIYSRQLMIIRTPQFFCCSIIRGTAWNTGRSSAFTEAIRRTVESLNDDKIILWDVHSLGTDDTICSTTAYSRRNVINLENQLLYQSICSTS
ncbi:hypothetical protein BDF20DRAFT_840598 [Mycotypha africana]|uniref:uncharacterized protein n=1 Tax=Mycotypha africana TaxID=64632 RepID=UPI002300E217|nr:uncharacterized protein BDF20DRAFT_840598 [Mycotypha africana]KAI8966937.1 hypothetical protein BDF20DRAFT_840598 [Mycotypha africana]